MKLKGIALFFMTFASLLSQGGYISIAYEFDLKSNQKGYQVSIGAALPFIGESGNGPFVFPGIVFGQRYSSVNNKSYSYTDYQIVTMAQGIWFGGGYGSGKMDGKKHKRRKHFIGWLPGGYVNESTQTANSDWQKGTFKGYHFGLAFPLIGNHFQP